MNGKTAILSVGTELLFGQILNTNVTYLSQQLNLLGFDVVYHYTVGDNPARLAALLRHALQDCDLIVATGGLGPTEDDLTKETVCRVLDDVLVEHAPTVAALEVRARQNGRPLTPNNYKQAMFPSRAVILPNDAGTAPGFALSKGAQTILCMPGPPREMRRMWELQARPYLAREKNGVLYYQVLRCFGIGESALETALLDLIDGQTDPTLATYAKEGECSVRIASKRATEAEAKAAVTEMIRQVRDRVGQWIYSEEDRDLAQVVGEKLIAGQITLSACESCTGGMFAEALTGVPGISAVFERGLVTYTWRAKQEELGVRPETLRACTAESPEVAAEMAEGLYRKTGSRICISVTGLAGPDGGTAEKPVGTVYIGCCVDGAVRVQEVRGRNVNRNWNRHYAVLAMLDCVNRALDRMTAGAEPASR